MEYTADEQGCNQAYGEKNKLLNHRFKPLTYCSLKSLNYRYLKLSL
jgi:hypothetical protein